MARGFKTEEQARVDRVMKGASLYPISTKAIKSIEEIARLSRQIERLGIGYLSSPQIRWLETGGLEAFKETKPLIYELIMEMKEKEDAVPFPVNLREVAELVQERIRERAKRGKVDRKWERIVVSAAEVDEILRFKKDPFFSRGEKTRVVVDTLVEILEEMYREEKKRHRVEEPEVKVALEVAKEWKRRFDKVWKYAAKK